MFTPQKRNISIFGVDSNLQESLFYIACKTDSVPSKIFLRNIKHFFRVDKSALWASCFHTISRFPNSTRVDITVYQHGKNVLYLFYNIAMSKARRIREISVFTSGGKFSVFTLSYANTALNQSAFRIHKCYIIISDQIREGCNFQRFLNCRLKCLYHSYELAYFNSLGDFKKI